MRVLIAVHGYPPRYRDGAELRAERTAKGLAARGFEVCVLCVESISNGQQSLHWEECYQDGVRVRRLHVPEIDGKDRFRYSYDNPQIASAFESFTRDYPPSALHFFGGYLISSSIVRVANQNRIPTLLSVCDYWWFCHRTNLVRSNGQACSGPSVAACTRCSAETLRRWRLPARVLPTVADLLWHVAPSVSSVRAGLNFREHAARSEVLLSALRSVDVVLVAAPHMADFYVGHGADPRRVRQCPRGVELTTCPIPTSSAKLRVGYVGQLKHHKGVHLLLEAWSKLRGPRERTLELYGSAHGEPKYFQRLWRDLQRLDSATYCGCFDTSERWQVLSGFDVLVVPSRWMENSPNCILEAQALGIPIVGSNVAGISELVNHEESGLLFEPDDASDLARQLQRLLDEPTLLRRLRRTPLRFRSFDDELDSIEAIYAELLTHAADKSE